MAEVFRSPGGEGCFQMTRHRSRFLGIARPVRDQRDAEAFLEALGQKFSDASHVAFAYRVGRDVGVLVERYSDAGEPSGTAGPPLLELLRNRDLDHAVVAVIRYFGGVKLGMGGLARAYREAGHLALEKAGETLRIPAREYSLETDYQHWGRLEAYISDQGYPQAGLDFGHKVRADLWVPQEEEDSFRARVTDISAGTITLQAGRAGLLARVGDRLEGDNCWIY